MAKIIPFKSKAGHTKNAQLDSAAAFKEKFRPLVNSPQKANVINLSERRDELAVTERRKVTRTVLSQFVGVFIVLPKKTGGLKPVSVHDVSDKGLAFDLTPEMGAFKAGESVTMRIYLSHETYFSFSVKVVNVRRNRHGTVFKKDDDSYQTLMFFSKFLQNVSLVARKDNGDRLLGSIE
jgi:hypothetical protein